MIIVNQNSNEGNTIDNGIHKNNNDSNNTIKLLKVGMSYLICIYIYRHAVFKVARVKSGKKWNNKWNSNDNITIH